MPRKSCTLSDSWRAESFPDQYGFQLKVLVFFAGAGEEEGVGHGGFALRYFGDDVGAAEPVSFGQIGGRPLRGVVGVRVIKACDVEIATSCFALDSDQFDKSNLIAVVGGIGTDVSGANRKVDDPAFRCGSAE